jgi:hypothetical protein
MLVSANRLHTRHPAGAGYHMPVLAVALACAAPAAAQRGSLAEKLPSLSVRHTSEHYALAGTVNDARLQEYGRALEWIHREYSQGRHDRSTAPDRQPAAEAEQDTSDSNGEPQRTSMAPKLGLNDDGRFPVVIFGTEREYHEFGREFLTGQTEHTGGMYLPGLDVLLILDRPDADDTYGVLFHEAFHQFMHRYVKDPPMWLNEGLAVYYESARPAGGGIAFSRPPKHFWQIVRKVMPKPEAIPLWRVVTADRAAFYDSTPIVVRGFAGVHQKTLYYAEAYTLIHLLLSDREGRERVQSYIRDLATDDGTHTRQITEKYFDRQTCDRLTHHWIRHVNSRPEQR